MRARQVRNVAKWAGVAACAVLVVVWVGSGWWWSGATVVMDGGVVAVAIHGGRVSVGRFPRPEESGLAMAFGRPGLQPIELRRAPPDFWGWEWWFNIHRTGGAIMVCSIPLWFPFLLTAAPTAWLVWRDRRGRFGPGCCAACGYDLAGLAAGGACPECGEGRASFERVG